MGKLNEKEEKAMEWYLDKIKAGEPQQDMFHQAVRNFELDATDFREKILENQRWLSGR